MTWTPESAAAAVRAIQEGDVATLRALLTAHPDLVSARVDGSRSLLHIATDWPGHRPAVADTIAVLVAAGADVNVPFVGPHTETPLHWAASNDDVIALDALLDLGADIEAGGGVIAEGTPILDATAFGQWNAARRLVARGADTPLWPAAALGLRDRVAAYVEADPPPAGEAVTAAFWGACHGGQRTTAEYLLSRGADPTWVGFDDLTPAAAAERGGHAEVVAWLAEIAEPSRS